MIIIRIVLGMTPDYHVGVYTKSPELLSTKYWIYNKPVFPCRVDHIRNLDGNHTIE